MRLFDPHQAIEKEMEYHTNCTLLIPTVLLLVYGRALTVAELSRLINGDSDKQDKTKFDLYALTDRLEDWGYIVKKQDRRKFKNGWEHCMLTKEGKEALLAMPPLILRSKQQCHNLFLGYVNSGLVSQI